VEKLLASARMKGQPPNLSGKRMWKDYTGVDFTSNFKSPYGPHTSLLLNADFRHAQLAHCNFTASDLAGANLRASNLTGAILRSANLYTALLETADLTGADLRNANLVSAELQEVTVAGANFEGARFGKTAIGAVDLSKAVNLDKALHVMPSPIGADTLRLTAAGLSSMPELAWRSIFRFLSSAGLDDEILSIVRSWIGKPVEFYSTFLSHSSLDKEFARKLYADLQAVGIRCWFDEKEILPGDNIFDRIDQGIRLWDKLILVCSKNSLSKRTGWWIEQELERAFLKERETQKRTGAHNAVLIPITIDNFVFDSWNSRFKASVLDKHVGDFSAWQIESEYLDSFKRLREALGLARHR
jgi:hypothetical protein